jgi:hypothetical protein
MGNIIFGKILVNFLYNLQMILKFFILGQIAKPVGFHEDAVRLIFKANNSPIVS